MLVYVLRTEVKNGHSGEQKWLDEMFFRLFVAVNTAQLRQVYFTQTAVDECIVSRSPDGCEVRGDISVCLTWTE